MVNFGVFLLFCFGFFSNSFGKDNLDSDISSTSTSAVYIVTLRQAPTFHLLQQQEEAKVISVIDKHHQGSKHGDTSKFTKPKLKPRY